jgi:hypothetical protein
MVLDNQIDGSGGRDIWRSLSVYSKCVFALVDRSTNVGFLAISGLTALLQRSVRCVQVDGVFQDDIQDWGNDSYGVVTTSRGQSCSTEFEKGLLAYIYMDQRCP